MKPNAVVAGGLAAFIFSLSTLALGAATTASADENSFVTSIASLNHYAIECPGCTQDAVNVGKRVCAAFDQGGSKAAVQAVLRAYNGPDQTNGEYFATLFAQFAANELCPSHQGEIGSI